MFVTFSGQVVNDAGRAVSGATVRLIGGARALGADPRAVIHNRGSVSWTRSITGFGGSRWNAWLKFVAPGVAGITWAEFRAEVGLYNPSLQESDGVFQPDCAYILPENRVFADTRSVAPTVVWDRRLTDFVGSRWACWRQYVQGKVVGLTWEGFAAAMLAENLRLAASGGRFQADQGYVLPRNAGQDEYLRVTFTGARGRFIFTELPPGEYQIEVIAEGYRRLARPLATPRDHHPTLTLRSAAILIRDTVASFVYASGRQFMLGQLPFRFVGVNLRGLLHYGQSDPVLGADVRQQLRAAREMGARVVRVFLPHCEVSAEETRGRLRQLLELMDVEFSDMYLIGALCNLYGDVKFRTPGDDRFYSLQPGGNGPHILNLDWFRGGYAENYLPFVKTIVSDDWIRRSPRLLGYNIGNELKAQEAPELLIEFIHAMARQIQVWDQGRHLITTGMISTRHAFMEGREELRLRLYNIRELAFITNHAYHGDDNESTSLEQDNDTHSRENDHDLSQRLGKPLLIEEAGIESQGDRTAWVQKEMDRFFGRPDSGDRGLGAAGYMPWGFMAGWDNGDGDSKFGLDQRWHDADWHSLRDLFRRYAGYLATSPDQKTRCGRREKHG